MNHPEELKTYNRAIRRHWSTANDLTGRRDKASQLLKSYQHHIQGASDRIGDLQSVHTHEMRKTNEYHPEAFNQHKLHGHSYHRFITARGSGSGTDEVALY